MTTTLPLSEASVSGSVLIQTSDFLISGAFCPTNASSGCCAYATPIKSKNASVNLASIPSPIPFWFLIRHILSQLAPLRLSKCLDLDMDGRNRSLAALRMALVRGLGLRSSAALLRHFKTPEAIFDSSVSELEAHGIPPDIATDL